jgi:transmembrane sensor
MPVITRELLAKFWMGLCTEEEAKLVEAYFEEHPEDDTLLEEFQEGSEEPIAPEDREAMLERVIQVTRPGGPGLTRRMWMMMAAASVLVVFFAGWMYGKGGRKDSEASVLPEAVIWTGKHNADSRNARVVLPDSTEVILAPDATVRYRTDTGVHDKREVKIEGDAVFSVRSDARMPFVVYSENVRTTVLGTIFEVSNRKGGGEIRVRLLQGKVAVGLNPVQGGRANDYLLKPGEEFIYGKVNGSIALRRWKSADAPLVARRKRGVAGKPDSLANWYMFNNQDLADVFDQLAILYNVEIQYSSVDLRNKYFIGKLETGDSLKKILSDIALLNHLVIVEQDGRYIVRKGH